MSVTDDLTMEARETLEKDTEDIEEIGDVLGFLLPPGTVSADCLQFSLSYNKRVLDGWVRQPSACCGAASVASAWNALAHLHRNAPTALTHSSVLCVYRAMFVSMICRKTASFERKLGSGTGSLLPLLEALREGLAAKGRSIGGKRATCGTKKHVSTVLKALARERHIATLRADPVPETDLAVVRPDAIGALVDLYLLEGVDLSRPTKAKALKEEGDAAVTAVTGPTPVATVMGEKEEEEEEEYTGGGITAEVEGEEDEDEDEKEAEEDGDEDGGEEGEESRAGPKKKGTRGSKLWAWLPDLMAILKNIAGLKKIMAPRPSTAPIGNWGIQQGVERLSVLAGLGSTVHARLFMGKAKSKLTKMDVLLSGGDSETVQAQQWDKLRAAFNHPTTVLLFHLKNHYALIHALREWHTPAEDGGVTITRQMLTARKGQRPTAWIDFLEARSTMLGWEGYKILAVTLAVQEGGGGRSALACFDKVGSLQAADTEHESEDSGSSSGAGGGEGGGGGGGRRSRSLQSLSADEVALSEWWERL